MNQGSVTSQGNQGISWLIFELHVGVKNAGSKNQQFEKCAEGFLAAPLSIKGAVVEFKIGAYFLTSISGLMRPA